MKRSKMLGVGKKSNTADSNLSIGGFTIIELLIATTVFSVIILVVSTGIIKIGNIYYKNITATKTQNVARNITTDIATSLQFSGSDATNIPGGMNGYGVFCIKSTRYKYKIGDKYEKGNEFTSGGIFTEELLNNAGCATTNTSDVGQKKQLLGSNMRLLNLEINTGTLSTVKIKVAYGDNDLLTKYNNDGSMNATNWSETQCRDGISGSSFCSVAELQTTVKRML